MQTNGASNGNAPAGGADFPDLPASDGGGFGGGGGESFSYIDEATQQMLSDDMPPEPSEQVYPEPVQPQSQPQAQPQLQPRPPVQPQRQPAQPAQPQPQAQPQQPAQQQQAERDPFQIQSELLEQNQEQYIQALAQHVYPISQEDMDAFLSGDSTKVSQALAKVHMNSVGSVMKVVSQYMPIWVGNMLKTHQVAQEKENSFWTANPGLNREQHRQMAWTAARTYRQMNPNATSEEMNRVVGAMVAAATGIGTGALPLSKPAVPRPAVPQNGLRTPGPVVRRTPGAFQPAGTQQGNGAAPAGAITNPWAAATEIMKAEEAGAFDGQL